MAGCIHIYCGDGKGKTTAALGLALRASGRGKQVLIARFLKTDDSGEVLALARQDGVMVQPCVKTFGFYYQMNGEQKAEAKEYYGKLLEQTLQKAVKEQYDMVILDEIMAACHYGLVEERVLTSFLKNRPMSMEVVLTGRNPSDTLLELADYVSEVQKRKHPYDQGVGAREGVEY